MEGFQLKSFEVKTSKTGLSVPVINGVHLHSIYDPIKEAQTFIDKYRDQLKNNSKALVFGLGYGYHIELIIDIFKRYYSQYDVCVIDPLQEVFDGCRRLRRINDENISIYAGHKIEALYSDANLVNFLSQKPTILPHPASMNLYARYFKQFMTHQAPTFLASILNKVESYDMQRSFERHAPATHYDDFVADLRASKSKFMKTDYLILALEEMAK